MDLALFFAETAEAAQAKKPEFVPGVPVSEPTSGNGQVSVNNEFSRISRPSRSTGTDLRQENFGKPQAGARACASGRAREPYGWVRETQEQREQPAGSDTCSSRFPSSNREIKRETGNQAPFEALPAGDGVALWRAGIARLEFAAASCPGYRGNDWSRVLARATVFLDEFGDQAEALGWTASRLFGVHPEIGIVRVDHCGALVLPIGGPVHAITSTEISFGHLTYREKLGQPKGIPLWELG